MASKRLALFAARARGFRYSNGLIDRRQFSNLTKDSKWLKFEAESKSLQAVPDPKPELEYKEGDLSKFLAMNSARHRQGMEDLEKSSREFTEAVQKSVRQRIIYFVPFIVVSSFAVAALINYELDYIDAKRARKLSEQKRRAQELSEQKRASFEKWQIDFEESTKAFAAAVVTSRRQFGTRVVPTIMALAVAIAAWLTHELEYLDAKRAERFSKQNQGSELSHETA